MTVAINPVDLGSRAVDQHAERWRNLGLADRLWKSDPTVWADPPVPEIADRLGWLAAPSRSLPLIESVKAVAAEAVAEGITNIVLCGMGGSSLAPEVFADTFPAAGSSPTLVVLDSTHPDAIRAIADTTTAESTWYIIASKSGGTVETLSFFEFFWKQAEKELSNPGSHFIAITDAGSGLASLATDRNFRATFLADTEVGGRYSALTAFGLVPAGLIGYDIALLLSSGQRGVEACRSEVPLEDNPGFVLGAILAERARQGHDKAQFLASGPVETIGIWIEQLIAESTGKVWRGIVPVNGGPVLEGSPNATIVSIGETGVEVPSTPIDIAISLDDANDLGELMFIFEFATAVAGEILGVNPFDQPDVESAKELTRAAMARPLDLESSRALPASGTQWLDDFVASGIRTPTYIAVQAYLDNSEPVGSLLSELAEALSSFFTAYVTTGIGPRFLHSTGQLHKGGPPDGLYLQITDGTGADLVIPERGYTFNELIAAQSIGDRAALELAQRAVVTVDLGSDTSNGLRTMIDTIKNAAR